MMTKETPAAKDAPPLVLIPSTATALLHKLEGLWRVIGELIYYTGARPQEIVRLRYRDLDLMGNLIRITDEHGETNRILRFPRNLTDSLSRLQTAVEVLHRWDRECGHGNASVPLDAYLKTDDAHRQLSWQYYFPDYERFPSGEGDEYRHHVELFAFEEELARAAAATGVREKISGYTLRHSRAVLLLQHGQSPDRVQAILGQSDRRLLRRYASLVEDRSHAA